MDSDSTHGTKCGSKAGESCLNKKLIDDDRILNNFGFINNCSYRKSVLMDDFIAYESKKKVSVEIEMGLKLGMRKKSSIINHLERKRKLTLF